MAELSQELPSTPYPFEHQNTSRIPPERLAWGILLMFFALFCVLCVLSSIGLYYFAFESTVSMETTLQVGRGTVGVTESDLIERATRFERNVSNTNVRLRTDSQSQSTLLFRENEPDGELLGSITLKEDTSMQLRRAALPRFDWSNAVYEIDLRDFSGEIDLQILGAENREFLARVQTNKGELIDIRENGRYVIAVSEMITTVISREGSAIIFAEDRANNRLIPAGQQAIILRDQSEIQLTPTYENLVENGLFVLFDTPSEQSDNGNIPLTISRWGCTNIQDDLPRGSFSAERFDGRSVVRLMRADNAQSHGETHCIQPEINQDVSDFEYLELIATFYINFQSLSECGSLASECPLMLRMEYVDVFGNDRELFQGFYYAADHTIDYPLLCASCTRQHENINEKAWYTYETGNLFTALSEDSRPAIIKGIEFYASGHQYDVFVSEIALLAGHSNLPTVATDASIPDS